MGNIKWDWERMTRYERYLLLKKNRFWRGLVDFPYRWIPDDLKDVLKRELGGKKA